MNMTNNKGKIVKDALNFVLDENEPQHVDSEKYCSNRDTFIARLDKFRINLDEKTNNNDKNSLVIAITGEIGNNSFDHNLGNWRDIPGVYFDYDLLQNTIVLADRGQGIKKTIQRVKSEINNDLDALKVAFTEIISGRAPEKRGNGLKFVSKIMQADQWNLWFFSGKAVAIISIPDFKLSFSKNKQNIKGTLAIIEY